MATEFELDLIHYILMKHDIHPDSAGQYHCPIPPHVDSKASANVWVGERGDALFGCWSHPGPKKAWKAAELLQALHPGSFENYFAAIRASEQLAIEMRNKRWKGPLAQDNVRAKVDANILRIRSQMARGSSRLIETFLDSRPDITRHNVTAEFLRSQFRVTDSHPDFPKAMYLPYLDREGNELSAAKYRTLRDKPLAIKGSDFSCALYGLWRDTNPSLPVILCEGESDVWVAAATVRGAAALGLPTGAIRPRPGQLALLEGRTGQVAFDNDIAGNQAAGQWLAALGSSWERLVLPEGTDFATGWNP